MAKSVLSRAWNIAVVMLVFPTTSAFAAEPSPTLAPRSSPSPRAISDVLITTNARIGEEWSGGA